MFASAVMVGACFFTLRTWSTWRIPVSTAPATIWVTRAAVVVVTKFTSFASIPILRRYARESESAKPPGSWIPMFLPLRSDGCLMTSPRTANTWLMFGE